MKTFLQFIKEELSQGMKDWMKNNDITRKMQAREPKEYDKHSDWLKGIRDKFNANAIRKDAPQTVKPEPVDFTGSRHSDGKTVKVMPDKPIVGKDDAVGKLLKQKGFDRTGKKLDAKPVYHPDHEVAKRQAGVTSANKIQDRVPQEKPVSKPAAVSPAKVQRPFPDKAPEKQFGQDTKMKQLKLNRQHDSDFAKVNKPAPKVGSLAVKQTGYPAAKKPSLAPAESQRASSGGSYKIQPGDNPTKIAKNLGLSLKDLEAKNPGILKRAKRLKIGGTINR